MNIPPNVVKHTEYATCAKECTERPQFAEPTCLKLISVNIHIHLIGKIIMYFWKMKSAGTFLFGFFFFGDIACHYSPQ